MSYRKSLLFIMVVGLGGGALKQGLGVREPLAPPGNVGEWFSFSVLVCEVSRIILYCSAQLIGPLVMGGQAPHHVLLAGRGLLFAELNRGIW